jgi:hypothetical protein
MGRYCGHVDLGKQYYVPASYYALVREAVKKLGYLNCGMWIY